MILAYILEFLKYFLLAFVLYFIARLIIQAFMKNEESKRVASLRAQNAQVILPLKLQACERLILYLERITPVQVISRTLQPGISASGLQLSLLQVIREEFEHNVAQQVYISPAAWAQVKTAKEELLLLINKAASETGPDATGHDLAKIIIERWGSQGQNPAQAAIDQLKAELGAMV
jgi:hypothetical protein